MIGLTEQDLIFLGYPTLGLRQLYDATSGSTIITSIAGRTETYGDRGLGGMEYHRYLYGVPGPYNRDAVIGDLKALLTNLHPDEVYTHSYFETHTDHAAIALFVAEALVALKREGVNLSTKLYQTVVWMPQYWGAVVWPQIGTSGWTPRTPIWAGRPRACRATAWT